MKRFKVEVQGDEDLKDLLQEIADALIPVLADAVLEAAEIIGEEARRLAPVDEGDLRQSIVSEISTSTRTRAVAETGPTVEYGISVEYGTHDTPAQPFLRPAADAKQERAVREIVDTLQRALDQVG